MSPSILLLHFDGAVFTIMGITIFELQYTACIYVLFQYFAADIKFQEHSFGVFAQDY